MAPTFLRSYPPSLPDVSPALWFPFRAGELLVQRNEHGFSIISSNQAEMAALHPQTIPLPIQNEPTIREIHCQLVREKVLI